MSEELQRRTAEFEKWMMQQKAIREAAKTVEPKKNSVDGQYWNWIACQYRLPPVGQDVILYFRDTFHTRQDWPEFVVSTAWRCNVGNDNPDGQWCLTGRLYGIYPGVIDIKDGIAWMALPEVPEGIRRWSRL